MSFENISTTKKRLITVAHTCPSDLLCTRIKFMNYWLLLTQTKLMGMIIFQLYIMLETAMSIYTPLVTHLFNTSIQLEELPDEWKLSCKA